MIPNAENALEKTGPATKRPRTQEQSCDSAAAGLAEPQAKLPPGSQVSPGTKIKVTAAPSLEAFWTDYMQSELPVVISGIALFIFEML